MDERLPESKRALRTYIQHLISSGQVEQPVRPPTPIRSDEHAQRHRARRHHKGPSKGNITGNIMGDVKALSYKYIISQAPR